MRVSQDSKSGVCLASRALASRRTSAVCSSSTWSFFLHHLLHRQVTELFTDPNQLIDDVLEVAHRLNLFAIDGDQGGIAQAFGHGLLALLASQQRIRAAFDPRTIRMLDHQKLFG